MKTVDMTFIDADSRYISGSNAWRKESQKYKDLEVGDTVIARDKDGDQVGTFVVRKIIVGRYEDLMQDEHGEVSENHGVIEASFSVRFDEDDYKKDDYKVLQEILDRCYEQIDDRDVFRAIYFD